MNNEAAKEEAFTSLLAKRDAEILKSSSLILGDKKKPEEGSVPMRHKRISMKSLMGKSNKKSSDISKKLAKKATGILSKFKSMQLSSQIPENEKIRQRIRENIFYGLILGFEELKFKVNKAQRNELKSRGNAKDLLPMNEKAEIDYAKGLTLEIEANLYHRFEKNLKKDSQYSQKSRSISMNLKNKKNSELRLKVLTKEISASQLCGMSDDDLAPKNTFDEIKQQRDYFMSSRMAPKIQKVIAKTRKVSGKSDLIQCRESLRSRMRRNTRLLRL